MSGENRDPRVEAEIGRSLERARKSRNLTLWQVEQETRIRSRYLRDLEREHFDVLPAVYVLGSLKTYADFLGLDGAALSRQLKARLLEPAEPDVSAQLAALRGARGEEDEYEASPVSAVGFDHLFLGMGVILISILAIMTLAAAVAQGDRASVSQVDQPSTPNAPSGIALAGNVEGGDGVKEDGNDGPGKGENRENQPENKEDHPEKEPESPKDGEDDEDGDGQQASSPFDGVEFVPVPQSSSTTASASASAASSSASPAPATVGPDDSPASSAPATVGASSPKPAASGPVAAPVASGGGIAPPRPAPVREERATPTSAPDGISAEVDRKVDEALRDAGLVR